MNGAKVISSLMVLSALGLAGCGNGFKSNPMSSVQTFTDPDTKTSYQILLERPVFLEKKDALTLKTKSESDKALAKQIKNVRLDMDDLDSSKLLLKLALVNGSNIEASASLMLNASATTTAPSFTFKTTSSDGRFSFSGRCQETFCDHASFLLTEVSSSKFVYIDYTRGTEYLKPEDLSKIKVSKEDKELLDDVIEYHLPITRHAAKVAGRESKNAIVDLLIVARPDIDTEEESFDDEEIPAGDGTQKPVDTAPTNAQPTAQPTPQKPQEHVIELEATSADDDVVPNTGETTTGSNTDNKGGADSKPDGKRNTQLSLTSNPYEVYNITIPKERLKTLSVRNPLQMANFEIIPAEQQQMFEPSFRIAVLAEAFVEQRVKIYQNACNFYVRAVMTLAGYTKGKSYNANQFGQLFQTKGQGLDSWAKFTFDRTGAAASGAVNVSSLQSVLNGLPEAHATVAQVDRSAQGKHGHVGIVARLDGVVYMMDGSLGKNDRGLRKQAVNAKQLLNNGQRKNLNMYGIKGIMKSRTI